jgi:SPP1 gp7 family putative phage head morphogenesis protein
MSRVLADGLVQGKTVDQVAKELDNETDIGANRARTVARTELTRAHAEGQLISMSHIGVSRTSAKVELSANGNACDQCASLDGKVYSLAKASGVIPVHPNCNCVWTPIPEGT